MAFVVFCANTESPANEGTEEIVSTTRLAISEYTVFLMLFLQILCIYFNFYTIFYTETDILLSKSKKQKKN